MYLKFIWQPQKHSSDCELLTGYPDVKYVRLGYIGTCHCNMEHIETPSQCIFIGVPMYSMFLISTVYVWDLRKNSTL